MRLSKLTEKDLSGLLKKTRDTYQIRLIVAYQGRLELLMLIKEDLYLIVKTSITSLRKICKSTPINRRGSW